MPTKMALWKVGDDGKAVPIEEEKLSAEATIESAIESAPELLGVDVLIVGRQVPTPSGPLDLLALDGDARLVVVENKRDRTPRDVLAQTIDYAAFVSTLTLDDVLTLFETYCARSGISDTDLVQAFEERFGEELDTIASPPQMVIVASRLDDSTERMIDFLADSFNVPVNAALFQPFSGGLVGRTWLRPEDSVRSPGRGTANAASRDESKLFWDTWLPIGRKALPEIRLPANGPRSVLIKRRILPGVPAALTVWVSSSEAYAEVQFDDDEPTLNQAMLAALKENKEEVESSFGGPLDWRNLEPGSQMTKRTKVVTPKVAIGSRAEPTDTGLDGLADTANKLLAAVKPHLSEAFERAAAEPDTGQAVPAEVEADSSTSA